MKIAVLTLLAVVSAGATTHCVVVSGLGGEPDYEQRFATWAQDLDKTLRDTPETHVETLMGAQATRASLRAALESGDKRSQERGLACPDTDRPRYF